MIGDRIEQTTTSTGTGPVTLNPPPQGRVAFWDAIPIGTPAYYLIENGDDWEEGIGTVGANSLTRDKLIRSSTGGFLDLSGTSVVTCTPLSELLGPMGGRLHMAASVSNIGTTYVITCHPPVRELVDGVRVRFRANVTNTLGGASADVNATGAKPIRKGDFAPMEPYEIRRNDFYEIVYDAEADCWQIQSPVYTVAPQRLINGDFTVAQRGTSLPAVAFGDVLLDRWRYLGSADGGTPATVNVSQRSFAPGQTDVPGEPRQFMRLQVVDVGSGFGPESNAEVVQRIVDVRHAGTGRVATRVWMRSTIPGKRVGFRLRRFFGTGGSTQEFATTGQSHELGTVWQPFEIFWNLASLSGRTIGPGSFLSFQIFFQWGSNFDGAFGTSGGEGWRQAGDIEIADAQLQPGHIVVPFPRKQDHENLIECLHFYVSDLRIGGSGYATAAGQTARAQTTVVYPVPMRVDPVKEYQNIGGNMNQALAVAQSSRFGMVCSEASVVEGSQFWSGRVNLDAEI